MSPRFAVAIVLLIVLVFAGLTMPFIVEQTEQAIVLQFGDPIRNKIEEPGLYFKLPYQSVIIYDKRVVGFDLPPAGVNSADQKPMIVDAYTRYRITDPLKFYQTVGTEQIARSRLVPIITNSVQNSINHVKLADVVSGKREDTMKQIYESVDAQAKSFGITITDVRLRRIDLPPTNSNAIYVRMKSDREREAAQLRAEGDQLAKQITAGADRQKIEILAEAQKSAQIAKGQGDADSIKISADAFGRDKDFFAFYRSLEAYKNALGGQDTTFVLSPDSEFFRYFGTAPKPSQR
ncbi:MAG TPA: protease modulator HflC [Stellaceae bacterium]|jgi:membrane protease subunit HflC|nr:protease modulator HflC [Stellaceae bacterium]